MIEVKNLSLAYLSESGTVPVLEDISFTLETAKILCVVGESGSGKSSLGVALLGLLPPHLASITVSQLKIFGRDFARATEEQWITIRGRGVGYIFQDALAGLNPVLRVGTQIDEAFAIYSPELSRKAVRQETIRQLREVGVSEPGHVAQSFPHELSGGLRQRVMLAIALAGNPKLLIADEPTSSLDVTLQSQVLDLLLEKKKRGMSVILITHDLGVVAAVADEVLVLKEGKIVEWGNVEKVFETPQHPYTKGLLSLRV